MRSEHPARARLAWLGLIVSSATLPAACSDEAGTSAPDDGSGGTFTAGAGGGAASGGLAGGVAGAAGFAASSGGTVGIGGFPVGTAGSLGSGGLPAGMAGAFGTGGLGMAGAFGTGGMSFGSGGDTSAGGSATSGGATAAGGGPLAKFAGNITTRGQVRSDFVDHWDQITPENEGKWGSVEGRRDDMSWDGLDAVYDYAKAHGIPFKQHTLVWGAQQPGWVAGLPQAEQRAEVEEWIRLFCERYPDTQMIDVVNEPPPHTTPSYMAALGGEGASGYDWIVQAFRWARQYCPRSILILNDYNTIEYGNDNNHFIDIVNRIRSAGAPIDAIGAQAHAAFSVPTDTVRTYIDRLAATGLPVYISEYDIDLADDNRQRQVMESQFTMFWNHPSVKGVTLWGYVQGSTWLDNSGLMSETGQMRPAMTWLMGYLNR